MTKENERENTALQTARLLLHEAAEACQDLGLLDLVYKLLVIEAVDSSQEVRAI